MKKWYLLSVLLCCMAASAQINIAPGNTITQTFDAMGSLLTLPANWKMAASTTSPSWSTASASVTAQASSGAPTTGGTYNWGSTATERAVGAMTSSGFASPNNLLSFFTNSGASNISAFTISYDAERYRINSSAASVQFYYSLNGTTWISVSAGDIASSSFPTGSSSYTFASPLTINRTGISITGLTLVPGSNFYLRWNINTTGSNSQGIGIDNVSVTAIGDAPPPTLTAGTISAFGNVCVGTNSTANSFTLDGSNLDGSQVTVGPLANYTLSGTANGPWTATLSPFYTGSSFSTTIYVHLSPTNVQFYDGNIPITGGGAAQINLAVTGAGINTPPIVAGGSSSSITQTTATITGSITDNGCGNITSYGIEYSTTNGFSNGAGTNVPSSNLSNGNFSSYLTGLSAATTYYYHIYATNSGGSSWGAQQSFTTLAIDPLSATAATAITDHSFTANWNAVAGAVNYKLDVATTNTFIVPGNVILVNWTFPNILDDAIVDVASALNLTKTISTTGANAPTFNVTGATTSAARATGWDLGSGTKYWQIDVNTTGYYNLLLSSKQRSSSTGPKDFKLQYKIGAGGTWTDVPSATITTGDNFTSGVFSNISLPSECNNQSNVIIRWIMTSNLAVGGGSVGSTGSDLIDDILITGNLTSCVPGYEDLIVNGTSQNVTGLLPSTSYYYRVRAFDGNSFTGNSNIITATTAAQGPLPVTLISFEGKRINNTNVLEWTTASEMNDLGFEVQRSVDGAHFSKISFVNSIALGGNSNQNLQYSFVDNNPNDKTNYYRLRQIDLDGRSKLSNVIMIRSDQIHELSLNIFPNPATTELNIQILSPAKEKYSLRIIDLNGRTVNNRSIIVEQGFSTIVQKLNDLNNGCYLLLLMDIKTGKAIQTKFIRQ